LNVTGRSDSYCQFMSISRPATIAAVDLGSNSFHMIVAATTDDDFRVIDRMREVVRLAAGLDSDNKLTDEAISRALACLEQFGERIRGLSSDSVRIVGTNTLRKARNSSTFIRQAEAALGHPIDIISGIEEARMIYLGVAHGLDDAAEQRLVMDIGGGSTEFILGRRFDPLFTESVHLGCVSHSAAHFADGKITEKRFRDAEIAARQELETFEFRYRQRGWQSVIGASGTILAVLEIVLQERWSTEGITAQSVAALRAHLIEAGHVEKVFLKGLTDERRSVIAGGVAILSAAFAALDIDVMRVSDQALREGLLYDLLGRIHQEDVRERTIGKLVERHQIDVDQSQRVAATALRLLDEIAGPWSLNGDDVRRQLRWAATLHEIGLSIAHSHHHKHGAYLLSNLEMPGFSRGEQRRLAALVRGHRRKLPQDVFKSLPREQADLALHLCVVMRLAIVLHRRRSEQALPPLKLMVDNASLKLVFPAQWLDAHPLTHADLASEAGYLKAAGIKLKYR